MTIEIPFQLKRGLIYIHTSVRHAGNIIETDNCIFDTGSAGTTFDADRMATIGLALTDESKIRRLAAVGGYQRVFTRSVDELHLGGMILSDIEIEIGDLTSTFNIDGIIGTDIIQRFDWELNFSRKILVLKC